ncbi:polyketide cyclase/dehydrase/lipid transport protein [Kribbella voronezhensis]|uniref:Polyketide cyclase/dehydrase/lipid transport protein n=1 Tax=Kribbella voronezhensis TaxID=2512212 RepID=A0A4R7SYQ7_9ACTN|nr:SRPBCC family protein [Kribbella voronezhensis]TDU84461.1 polyketide cyclase/dehydrase/lipid transport protein [Kribbella voronezhensis]
MWTTEYTQTTDAAPEALWELLRDVNGWGAWNEGIESITVDGPVAVGATFQMKPAGEDAVSSTIVELDEKRLITDVTELGDLVIRVAHQLDPVPGGGTTVTFRIEVSGPAADNIGDEVGTAISADFPDVIAALVAAARAL